ncbi:MAG: fumarate hydratase, partial [Clostridiales bacterium]|nr:fumarate hydratase [Clostridiales bacterium]
MRRLHTDEIIRNIKEMCIEANLKLSPDMEGKIRKAYNEENSELGRMILGQLGENLDIAANEAIPICQDTGMAVVFIKLGQELHIEGMDLEEAINEGIRQGYEEGYLRKSVVSDPFIRNNTRDNTPGIIHYQIVPGDRLEICVAPKGFGSENMSRIYMLKPSDGIEGAKKAVLET